MFEGTPQSEVEALLKSDSEFRQLYHRHRELDKQVLDAELGVLPIDDTTLMRMKKEKLFAKDRLTRMFEEHQTEPQPHH
ncbi:MAG TPA: YdcH family protein [Xanthomonadaceae bacterium]|nr:YdcH family protein [Xanthomonadaceae bacterium]